MNATETKRGVLVYEPGFMKQNIGDYVQSLAARQYFNDTTDIYLNREYLNAYSGEPVDLIMNGWFTHQPQNWPPSKDINPLFVSFHINSLAKEKLLSSEGIKYFKEHEPIGCRDKTTVDLLRSNGVNAYFSGCLTLTLGRTYSSKSRDNKVYFVDAHYVRYKTIGSVSKALYRLATDYDDIKTLAGKLLKSTSLKSLIVAASFYNTYIEVFEKDVILNAEYIEHYYPEASFKNEEEKFELAKKLLEKYAKASLVVTSRIHCALPALGLETPVVYINDADQDESSYCRLDGIVDLFNVVDYKKGKLYKKFNTRDEKIGLSTKILNPDNYKVLRNTLIEKCENFLAKHNLI